MRRLLTLVALSALAAAPLAARADGSIQLGARAGVSKPFGDIGNGQKLGDFVDWAFPLEADLQFRIVPEFSIGAYGRFSPTTLKSGCPGCSANDLGLGLVGEYRFSGKLEGGPWIDLFAGYNQLKLDQISIASGKQTATLTGYEVGVSSGIDFELGGLTLGPFLQFTIGEFLTQKYAGVSQSIDSKGAHAFFGGGIRIALLL